MLELKITCTTCQQINRQRAGEMGFEILNTEFYSLTDALTHIKETAPNGEHDVRLSVEESSEDE